MHVTSWPCPLPDGGTSEELVVQFDQSNDTRLLVIPALFDEANKLRRFSIEVMRRLSLSGVDCFLPDLPGCNESTASLDDQTLENWREAASQAAAHFDATYVLAIRGGALLAPHELPGWLYAPQEGSKLLRAMLRARIFASREAERDESVDALSERGRTTGIELAGWNIGAELFRQLEIADLRANPQQAVIAQSDLGGAGLWLRAEPDEDHEQADALAAMIAIALEPEA